MSTLQERLRACDGSLAGFIEAAFPGESNAIRSVRGQVFDLCSDPLARGALILGPAGTGKSTIARVIALGRRLALLRPEESKRQLEIVRTEGPSRLSRLQIPWLVEKSLPGLVGELAESQLFGHEKGAFTGADAVKYGVFELAAFGSDASALAEHYRTGARGDGALVSEKSAGTFGVVFLDEIGDLQDRLQPKLLAILSGGEGQRLGGEGLRTYRYLGLTLAATWRDVDNHSILRQDLRARLSDHIIRLPSLAERPGDLPLLAQTTCDELKDQVSEWNRRLEQAPPLGINRPAINELLSHLKGRELEVGELAAIQSHDWSRSGELRGLTQVLRRVLVGRVPLEQALAAILREGQQSRPPLAAAFLEEMLRTDVAPGTTVPKLARVVFDGVRAEIIERIRTDESTAERLASHLQSDPGSVRHRSSDLEPRRSRRNRPRRQ